MSENLKSAFQVGLSYESVRYDAANMYGIFNSTKSNLKISYRSFQMVRNDNFYGIVKSFRRNLALFFFLACIAKLLG